MFSFVAIFIFILFWIFILIQVIDRIFRANQKIQGQSLSLFFISISLIMSFVASMISFYLMLIFLLKLPVYLGLSQKIEPLNVVFSETDCSTLTKAFRQTESKIHQETSHRFLEETAHLFTIKLEYQKVADHLQEEAEIYNNLELSVDADNYAKQIGTKLQEQSALFIERNEISPNKEGIKKVYKLLKKMDETDRERLRLVNQVKQQCNNTA